MVRNCHAESVEEAATRKIKIRDAMVRNCHATSVEESATQKKEHRINGEESSC